MTERILDNLMDAAINFRELGGYKTLDGKTIKHHKILRSANLAHLTEKDQEFIYDYGLRTDIDFRSKGEIDREPDLLPDGIEYVFNPIFKYDETKNSQELSELEKEFGFTFEDGFTHMIQVYKDIILDEASQKAYRSFFDQLLANEKENESVLFHCTAGKDRTGMGAVYFLSALGVDEETIKKDYLLTNKLVDKFVNGKLDKLKQNGANEDMIKSVHSLLTVNEDYLNTGLTTIKNNFGSMNNYLNDVLKISPSEINDLKQIYLN